MESVIVAGASGFIGKKLVRRLCEIGYSVNALDTRFDDELNALANCINVENKSLEEISIELKGTFSCFYNLAWVGTSGAPRADYSIQLNNVRLTCDYVQLAAMIHCPRVIYASSINEMESYEYLQSDNITPSGGYIYGAGKLAAHMMGETVAYQCGVEFIPVIITNIYGIGEKSARLIYTSICKLLRGEHCSYTSGNQMYDFIYIDDAINSIIAVAEKGNSFCRYYIGSGKPRPLKEFLITMRDVVAPSAGLGFGEIPFNGVSIDYNQFDMMRVQKDTGYNNKISFPEGIKMTAEYIRKEEQL